jgi:NinB protein
MYFVLSHDASRANAIEAIKTAPQGYCVSIKAPTRSLEQNALMWSVLNDIARQVEWYGEKLTSEDWKTMLTASVKKQKTRPGIDGGFVVMGTSTSKMTVSEMTELIELAYAFGDDKEVQWTLNN